MDAREMLMQRLHDAGVEESEIQDGDALATRAVEVALGGVGDHSLTAAARTAGISPAYLREIMQALGRPDPPRGSRAYTDEDVELARLVRVLVDVGLPRSQVVEVARILGQSTSQIAEALRQLIGDAFLEPGDSRHSLALRYAQVIDRLGPLVPTLLSLTVRAHLRDGLQRDVVTDAEREAGALADTREVAVAFADLAGYTALGAAVGPETLGSIAGRFAELATTAVRPPVRLVKMIGDGAMFVSPDVPALCATLVELRELVEGADPELPPVRIGVAFGPATARAGDWYGATVNLASRLTESAKPGQIMAADEVVERASRPGWRRRRKLRLKGVEQRVRVFSDDG